MASNLGEFVSYIPSLSETHVKMLRTATVETKKLYLMNQNIIKLSNLNAVIGAEFRLLACFFLVPTKLNIQDLDIYLQKILRQG
jgi:hypothetical protein